MALPLRCYSVSQSWLGELVQVFRQESGEEGWMVGEKENTPVPVAYAILLRLPLSHATLDP